MELVNDMGTPIQDFSTQQLTFAVMIRLLELLILVHIQLATRVTWWIVKRCEIALPYWNQNVD